MEYITISDVIEFLCDHETAGQDFCDFFAVDIWDDPIEDLEAGLEPDKVLSWILDHEILSRDLLMHISDLPDHVVDKMTLAAVAEMLADRFGVIHY